jgi:aspartate ammonia-lyase
LGICLPEDLVEATQDSGEFSLISSIMKAAAVQPSKICNDLALELSSGPRCGLYELRLSPLQPVPPSCPGKVNPVIPEVVSRSVSRSSVPV